LLGKVAKPPYVWKISKATAGTYRFWAKAIDSIPDTAISNSVTVTVRKIVPNLPPTVAITSPVNGATFNAVDTIIINATAKDSDGFVLNVEFLVDSIYSGNDSIAPFQNKITGLLAGTHKLQAIAFDNQGATGYSSIITITVKGTVPANKPPVVSITSPANNSTLYLGDTLKALASASDPDGFVRSVKFYRDSTLLVSDTAAPYVYLKVNPATGVYKLHAVATDNSGAATTSSTVAVTVLGTRRP
jgi:chitinase